MASVQASTHASLPDFFNRIRCFDQAPTMPLTGELQYYSSLLHKPTYNGAMQPPPPPQQQQQSFSVYNEMGDKNPQTIHEQSQNFIAERFNLNLDNNNKKKRMRTLEQPSYNQDESFIRNTPPSFFAEPPSMAAHTFTTGKMPIVSTGLCLSTNVKIDECRVTSVLADSHLPSAFEQIPDTILPLSQYMQTQVSRQRGEMHRLIDSQAERMKQALEETTKSHMRGLISMIEGNVTKRLKVKDDELEKANRKSLQLEERLKQLTLEAQLWRNLAKNNELMAINLRQSLEQVMVQARNQQKKSQMHHLNLMSREEGCGESSEVDDAESCQIVGTSLIDENRVHGEMRKCKICKVNEVCMLLLPCRHLCLCRDCERGMDACPACGTTKNASVQVYMS